MAELGSGKYAEALEDFDKTSTGPSLRAVSKGAMEWQQQLVAENEKKRRENVSFAWMMLMGAGLFALSGAIMGQVVLTSGIAKPLSGAVKDLEQISHGDLS